MAPRTYRVNGFRRGTLGSELVSFLNASDWRDTEVVSASMRKDYIMTLVRSRPSSVMRCCLVLCDAAG